MLLKVREFSHHLESKFDGDIGTLERNRVQADSVVYIGKEANNIDEQVLLRRLRYSSTSRRLWMVFSTYHKSRLKHWEFLGVRFKGLRRG